MNQKEQARLSVLNSVLEYQVPITQAAELLGVTQRHARRMMAAYRENGAAALAHGNRGRRPHNATSPGEAAAVVRLATERYEGASHTHLTELLSEREGIDLSPPTVRRILTRAGIGSPRSRRSPQHRFRRPRMPQAGMLIQLDGSHHAWLEDRSPQVRAAAGSGRCHQRRGQRRVLRQRDHRWLLHAAGGPDRGLGHPPGTVQRPPRGVQAQRPQAGDRGGATQFTRSLQELGIRQIFARSPQAKGRVERAAGTFQDRLVTELRLSDARTMDQATAVLQDFLPRYNARFTVQPEHPEPAYRPADPDLCLLEILCFKDTRKVARDNTVKYNWRVLQLLPDQERTSYAGLRVEVLERPDGELIVRYEGSRVATQEPPPRMGALSAGVTAWSPGPELKRVVSSVGDHHISRSQQRHLAALEPVRPAEPVLKPCAGWPLTPFLTGENWNATVDPCQTQLLFAGHRQRSGTSCRCP